MSDENHTSMVLFLFSAPTAACHQPLSQDAFHLAVSRIVGINFLSCNSLGDFFTGFVMILCCTVKWLDCRALPCVAGNGSGLESPIGAWFPFMSGDGGVLMGGSVPGQVNSGWQLVTELTKLFRKAELYTEKIFFLWAAFRIWSLLAG
ncbi:hypothetical protein [Marinobacter segnicrescens]|nr:hypothetical protein [Marinobacter segnicrescens]